jgi:hypothetical protein
MKKIGLFVLISFMYTSHGFSQVNFKQLSEQQIKNLLSHKWQLTFLEAKGKKMNVPANKATFFLKLKPDGTMEEISGDKKFTGSWSYKHDNFTLITEDKEGKESCDIINLTNNLLIIKSKYMGIPFNMGMQLVD